jgi:hypothetical protein
LVKNYWQWWFLEEKGDFKEEENFSFYPLLHCLNHVKQLNHFFKTCQYILCSHMCNVYFSSHMCTLNSIAFHAIKEENSTVLYYKQTLREGSWYLFCYVNIETVIILTMSFVPKLTYISMVWTTKCICPVKLILYR